MEYFSEDDDRANMAYKSEIIEKAKFADSHMSYIINKHLVPQGVNEASLLIVNVLIT